MTRSDLDFAESLRAAAGWNQTRSDWERFLICEPEGCFVAEHHGAPAGTATTIYYGPQLAWIGMLLVDPSQRRHGIGSALVDHCISHLQRRGAQCIKLDATPLGQGLYESAGFKAEYSLARWQTESLPDIPAPALMGLSPVSPAELAEVTDLDARAFGVARPQLLRLIADRSCAAVYIRAGDTGRMEGFGFLREGVRAFYLGPVTSQSRPVGEATVRALLQRLASRRVFWDILEANGAATNLAESLGFTRQRPLLRMYLGENLVQGVPALQFGIIDPAVG